MGKHYIGPVGHFSKKLPAPPRGSVRVRTDVVWANRVDGPCGPTWLM